MRCTAPCLPPCDHVALKKGGLCLGHKQRKVRGKPIDTPLRARKAYRPVTFRLPEEQLQRLLREAEAFEVLLPDVLRAAADLFLQLPPEARKDALRGEAPPAQLVAPKQS